MGFSLHLQEIAICAFLAAIVCLWFAKNKGEGTKKNDRKPPEPAGAWPFIGHLLLLGENKLFHRTLESMAEKYGPAFCIRLGIHKALVISSWEVAKECFTTYDKAFPTRPRYMAVKFMGYDHAMFGFAPYGPYWRDVRKLAMLELLSIHRLELLKHVRDTETKCLIKDLYGECVKNGGKAMVDMKEWFGDMTTNIVVRVVAGKRYFGSNACGDVEESRRCQKAMADFFYLMGLSTASDTVPLLGWLDVVKGYTWKMKRTARELDSVLGRWLQEHRERRVAGKIEEGEQDFIHVMLSVIEDGQFAAQDADTAIKATCLSLILGNDTTVITLTWAVSLLLNNRHTLKRAQEELDIHVGKHRQVEESDIKKLVYLQAIVKETLRLYPPLPASVPREAMEDCTIAGFQIPAGTRLLVNLWTLHRDPSIWSNPTEFQPERFIIEHANVDVRGMDFEYIPFGSGRRKCPGISFALQVLHLTLARLLHGFKLGTVSDGLVDMTEGPGLSLPKATPLDVFLEPSLPSNLYQY